MVRGLCAEVGGEEVHADVGGAFAEVVRGEVGCLGGDGFGGVGESSEWGEGAEYSRCASVSQMA
jgi:hypothetical protein